MLTSRPSFRFEPKTAIVVVVLADDTIEVSYMQDHFPLMRRAT